MYMPIVGSDRSDGFTFRRYLLSDDKCFANFFHPEKQRILTLVQNFMEKGGKFAIAGYPHKLGFLLHGPPGTGKTSFIKALAQMTGRDILNVPLSRINTNQELMDLMFTQKVRVSRSPLQIDKGLGSQKLLNRSLVCASGFLGSSSWWGSARASGISPQ
jgi:hypothetical protein